MVTGKELLQDMGGRLHKVEYAIMIMAFEWEGSTPRGRLTMVQEAKNCAAYLQDELRKLEKKVDF